MSYELLFHPDALDEFSKLDKALREHFKKKPAGRLLEPHVPASGLSGHGQRYKIKLRAAGYRLVYEVREAELIVLVLAVGKRERSAVYTAASKR